MKKIIILVALAGATAIGSNLYAQQTPPPGAGDKDLRDTDVKTRSAEFERLDRDAKKKDKSIDKPGSKAAADKLAAKYAEIKIDFERIQLLQDSIIKTYQSGEKIDYAEIGKLSLEMNESAARLDANLFPAAAAENPGSKNELKKDVEKEIKPAKSIRNLIVELDEAVGGFAASPMFQNLRTVDAAVSEKARQDMAKIIELSAQLRTEAAKTAAGAK